MLPQQHSAKLHIAKLNLFYGFKNKTNILCSDPNISEVPRQPKVIAGPRKRVDMAVVMLPGSINKRANLRLIRQANLLLNLSENQFSGMEASPFIWFGFVIHGVTLAEQDLQLKFRRVVGGIPSEHK